MAARKRAAAPLRVAAGASPSVVSQPALAMPPASDGLGGIKLNDDQIRALTEITAAWGRGDKHLLTGGAGSGKTTLMMHVALRALDMGQSIVMTAPTHKAVSVLGSKLDKAGLSGVDRRTIHSLLQLTPKVEGDRQVFRRGKHAKPVECDVVVIDECSMLGVDLMGHIRRYLPMAFTLFVGDPAQLPPVNEEASESFQTKSRSHLDTIVRQGRDNPVLLAAHAIRASQGGPADWSWVKTLKAPGMGVYVPGASADRWMQKGFTSPEFADDPDSFRYLAWTNDRVARVNRKVRAWLYGDDIPTPFVPGERALFREPLVYGDDILFNTGEEAPVLEISKDTYRYPIKERGDVEAWTATVPSWRIVLKRGSEESTVHMAADDYAVERVTGRIIDEARKNRARWKDLHEFKSSMAKLQSIYCMTVHRSQGSTFRNCFLDVADIRRRERDNLLEMQQLFYVAATRPTHSLVLVGV